MSAKHRYKATIRWTGNRGKGTAGYRAYGREHRICIDGKPDIAGSADPVFRGDAFCHNPEDMLLASVSACHMLWYLHLCAEAGVIVTAYKDAASGVMAKGGEGRMRFAGITLRPQVTLVALATGADLAKAEALHHDAHDACFIANSVNFPIECEPVVVVEAD